MEIKVVSEKGLNFISNEEGVILHPYRDSVGILTIGIGNTYYSDGTKVQMSDPPISLERAQGLFRSVLQHYEQAVWSLTRDDINQNQFDALVSLCYNIGVNAFKNSTLLKLVNAGIEGRQIKDAFEMWRRAGEDKTALLSRRIREAELYLS